jgi:glycerate-2-kinase
MKKVIATIVIATLGIVGAALPAGASLSNKSAAERQIKNNLIHKKWHANSVTSVKCVGAAAYTGPTGSKFTCYAYNRGGSQVGVVKGTNLGQDEANFNWVPNF